MCVGYVHLSTGTHRGWKKVLSFLELEFQLEL